MIYTADGIANAIGNQHRHVRALLDKAEDAQDIANALNTLDVLAPLWRCCNHGSAAQNLYRYAGDVASDKRKGALDMLASARLKPREGRVWTADATALAVVAKRAHRSAEIS